MRRVAAGLMLLGFACSSAATRAEDARTIRLSPLDGSAFDLPALAGDGRSVAFVRGGEVFVRGRPGTEERLASISNDGARANGDTLAPSFDLRGRFVAFTSFATNLAPVEPAHGPHLFVRDLAVPATLAVGHPAERKRGDSWPALPVLSGDGRSLAYISRASDLVAVDANDALDVFVYDLRTWRTRRVSEGSGGTEANADSTTFSLSHSGRYVAFASEATNLAAPDRNGVLDVFVHDRAFRVTTRVSRALDGEEPNGHSDYPAISADGRFVAFSSAASNLVPTDRNEARDVFVYDRASGRTERISVASGGREANGDSDFPALSGDGRFVAFASRASNLVAGDRNEVGDVFVHNRRSGETFRASVGDDGSEGDDESGANDVQISADGACVLFDSLATNLTPERGPTPAYFVRELRPTASGAAVRSTPSTSR